MDEIRLDPVPSILIESLRDIGYSFNTAVADIIDNSISAGATRVDVLMEPSDTPCVAIVDDGAGLTREELLESMRLGSTDPKQERAKSDLGRFGLGMKTASFSQCRRLTVVSRSHHELHGFIWDLDDVVRSNSWTVTEIRDCGTVSGIEHLKETGTLVLWEKLDRLVYNLGGGKPDVTRILNEAADHLSLVFHRYLEGERGLRRVEIRINNTPLRPIDPFNSKHPSTQVSPEERPLAGVIMCAYTLPNRDAYKTQREYDYYGLGDYLKNQGIYLYRAKRLILYGTWLGLARKSAITQLCRVRIDIDNGQDEVWKIDVKKASAQLPENVRARVRGLVNTMAKPSKRVYKRRGAKQVDESVSPVWKRFKAKEGATFSIDRDHPSIRGYRDSLQSIEEKRAFDSVLGLVEAAFPVKQLFYDLSTDPERVSFSAISEDELATNARNFFGMMKGMGTDDATIISTMRLSEPFASRWEETCKILDIEES